MGLESFQTRAPAVRVERRAFERIVDASGGLGIPAAVRFEAEIHWLREVHASSAVFGPDGRKIERGSTYHDFHGFLSCIREALLDDAPTLMESFDVRADGRLRVEVTVDVHDVPAVPVVDGIVVGKMRTFARIPRDWCYAPSPEIAAWLERHRDPDWDRYAHDMRYVSEIRHPPVAIFDSRSGIDVAAQVGSLHSTLAFAFDGLPEDEVEDARVMLDTIMSEARQDLYADA